VVDRPSEGLTGWIGRACAVVVPSLDVDDIYPFPPPCMRARGDGMMEHWLGDLLWEEEEYELAG
jgi:hypothetical protein